MSDRDDRIAALERQMRAMRDAKDALFVEINPHAWAALKASAATVSDGWAYNGAGDPLGHAFRSEKYGHCCYRITDPARLSQLRREAIGPGAELHALQRERGDFKPCGEQLVAQRFRSVAGRQRPAGFPRGAWYERAAREVNA